MQGVHTALVAGMLVAGGIYAGVGKVEETAIDPAVTASVDGAAVYRLAARGTEGGCRFIVSPAKMPGSQAVRPDPSCGALIPHLAAATTWSEDGDGSVVVTDAQGRTLAEFAPGDGIAYVSQDDGAPRFTLESDF